MVSRLRRHFAFYLASHRIGTLSLVGSAGLLALPVRYESRELVIACLVPRWAEAACHLEHRDEALLIIPAEDAADRHWLACRGPAHPADPADWPALSCAHSTTGTPDNLYQIIEIAPARLDLIDERNGWGWRENLDL